MRVILRSLTDNTEVKLYSGLGGNTGVAAEKLTLKKLFVTNTVNVACTVDIIIRSLNRSTNVTSRNYLLKDVIIPVGSTVDVLCGGRTITTEYDVVARLTNAEGSAQVYLEYDIQDDSSFVANFNTNN